VRPEEQPPPAAAGPAPTAEFPLVSRFLPAALNVVEFLVSALFILVLAAFLVLEPTAYRDGLRSLLYRGKDEALFDRVWGRVATALRHWSGGIIIEMTLMGTLAGLGLWAVGINGALSLGVLTFFATFVPYLGAIASSIPGLLMGLAKSPSHLVYAALVYSGVHVVEGYLVSPFVMRHALSLRPGLLLFWQVLMGTLFGTVGIMVATPLLACVEAAVGYLYIEQTLKKTGPRV
jgi:predicted PurR-regulated permease PerM